MFEVAFVFVACVFSYLIGTYVGKDGGLLAEMRAIRAESRRLRAIYAEQENEDG